MPDAKFPLSAKEASHILQGIFFYPIPLTKVTFLEVLIVLNQHVLNWEVYPPKVNFLKKRRKVGGDEHFV